MPKRIIISFICLLSLTALQAQTILQNMQTPDVALKTNLLYDALLNVNIGAEFKVHENKTLDISTDLNFWKFSENKKYKHVFVQPELRHWLCEPFNKHFLGIHAHYGYYNVGNINLPFNLYPSLQDKRYQGWLVGGGFSYGYQWYLGPHWNLEATAGVGYTYAYYHAYKAPECGDFLYKSHKNYFGITKLGLSLVYIIK